jgi:hypothetical protein
LTAEQGFPDYTLVKHVFTKHEKYHASVHRYVTEEIDFQFNWPYPATHSGAGAAEPAIT